jgi:mono/diheme cytochrome c family protein
VVKVGRATAVAFVFAAASFLQGGDAASRSIWDGVFSEAQSQRGEALYQEHCSGCHGAELISSDPEYPNLTAPQFRWNWGKKTLAERLQRVRTSMPPAAKDSLPAQDYLDVITFILKVNGYPAGAHDIKADSPDLPAIIVDPPK